MIVALSAALVALLVALGDPAFARASGVALAVELAAGLALAVAGTYATDRRRGRLLQAAAVAWLAAEWANPGAGALVFTLGLLLAPFAPALVAHALSRLPLGYAGAALVVLFTDPRAHGCGVCPASPFADAPELARWGLRVYVLALVASVVVIAWRMWRASPAVRRGETPVLAPGAVYLVVVSVAQVEALRRGWDGGDPLVQSLALLALAAGVAWRRLAARRMRARLARLVVDLGGPRGLRDLLADALRDPELEVLYSFDDGWIDREGTPRALPADRPLTRLVQDGEVTAVVIGGHGAIEDAAIRIAIDHERLQAQRRAQLARLRASRAAIVAAADAERRRLERDLHDGAQQALAGLAMAIGLARGANGATGLARAQGRVREALNEVRAIAHAAYPPALDEAGLAAALDVLSEWRPHVELGRLPDRRLDPALEVGVYFIVVALTAAPAVVDLRVEDELIVEVTTATPADLTEVEDRVGALGGRLTVGEGRVSARFACA